MHSKFILILIALAAFLASGCSLKKLALGPTVDLVESANPALDESDDLVLTEEALPSMIIILEGLLRSDPQNSKLRFLLAKAYGSFAFAFIEDRFISLEMSDPQKALEYKERAKKYYMRGRDHALHILKRHEPNLTKALTQDMNELDATLKSFDKKSLPFLFWATYNWGNFINLSKDNPDAIAELSKVERMAARVLVLDEGYYYASPHIFYGVYFASRPTLLGGDTSKAKIHFDRAISLTEGKYLPALLFKAQFYAVAAQDQPLFESLLTQIRDASLDLFPEQRLANALAKRNAINLLKRTNELF